MFGNASPASGAIEQARSSDCLLRTRHGVPVVVILAFLFIAFLLLLASLAAVNPAYRTDSIMAPAAAVQ